jgi:hypothetical protein
LLFRRVFTKLGSLQPGFIRRKFGRGRSSRFYCLSCFGSGGLLRLCSRLWGSGGAATGQEADQQTNGQTFYERFHSFLLNYWLGI